MSDAEVLAIQIRLATTKIKINTFNHFFYMNLTFKHLVVTYMLKCMQKYLAKLKS